MSRFPSLPWTDAAAKFLEGTPNLYLTLSLFGLALIFVLVAWLGKPWLKALVIAWALLP